MDLVTFTEEIFFDEKLHFLYSVDFVLWACNFVGKKLLQMCFPEIFSKFFGTAFLQHL